MLKFLQNLDRRWLFLMMFIVVTIPILTGVRFKETPSPMVRRVFNAIENLPEGSTLLMAYDYDPASDGELQPMAAAFTRHAALKKHKLIYMALWPQGGPKIEQSINILNNEFPGYEVGEDYVNLGFRAGNEGVIRLITDNFRKSYANDVRGTSLDDMPITQNIRNVQDVDLIVNVSAGYPGTKEWVLYAASPYYIPLVAGATGVQAPILYPYVPDQIAGLLAAIKGAAEYEQAILEAYPEQLAETTEAEEALRRMGPQQFAHMLLISLILLGNGIFFATSSRRNKA